eukprot:TRINITY_DN7968_c0_g1_i1.p1 TRINITY_DN7968_c0_g1~~TRINITY_DN7968_c0_g1_i1.p1  ORF type:complete len:702 (-),score=219.95 TRINITY_DN7968_c0_g1_i1:63-2168(-)
MCGVFVVLAAACGLVAAQHMPSVLIKQAADSLLHAPFMQHLQQYQVNQGLGRIEIPSPEDLIIRRLQGELALRVDDNWQSLNDPQRWAIMQTKDPAKQILKSFEKIKLKAAQLEKEIDVEAMETVLNNLSLPSEDMVDWVRFWDKLRKKVGQIAQLYNYFRGYIEKPEAVNKNTLQEFATSATQSSVKDRSLQNMLDLFHSTVVPTQETSTTKSLFPYLHSLTSKAGQHLCSMNQSPHQLVYNLYNIIALTEIKGYAMLQFSYMMLRIYEKGNFSVESTAAKEKFEQQATEKMNSIKLVLPNMSREFMKCDPPQHKQGETYLEITKLLQGYIENEVDMNDRMTCKSSCSAYTFAESKSCYKDLFCAKQPKCNGRIFDCQFFHADAWVCMAGDGGARRYDWVEYEDGTLLGNKGTCVNKIKVDSWWRYIFWHCSYCLCKCDEVTEDSDRFWSLLPAVADTTQNKIVTGLRFVKRGKIVYPQIEQATALSEGGIDETTRTWVEPNQIAYSDVRNLTKNTGSVFTMSYEQRAMDMDTLTAPEGHVLTGVKLRNIGGHLNLEIQVTPMEFTAGNVVSDRSTWIANDNTPATDKPRTLVPIIMPDIPTKFAGPNTVDTTTDQFIQFDASSAHKDVSQTTVPFIDAQPVAPTPATWLAGAGLYHKGRVGYGGFVGLKVSTYDFSRHLIPDSQEKPVLRYEFVKAEDA